MKVWISPDGTSADLSNEIGSKAVALQGAWEKGVRFLALPVENLRDSATWILASFRSGVTAVPLPPGLPIPAQEARLAQLPAGKVAFSSALSLSLPPEELPPLRPLEDHWILIFTSGSSGNPKAVALSGKALKANALAHATHSNAAKASWLLDLPLYHIGGLSTLTRAFFNGSPLALGSERFDPESTSLWIESGLIQGISLVPTTLHRLLSFGCTNFSPLRMILLGGAPASDELQIRAHKAGAPIRLTYGMTENASQIATETTGESGLKPLPCVEIKIGPDKEILIRSPMLSDGFFQEGRLAPLPVNEHGFFHTGDLGEFRDDKLVVSGRKSELIISGGLNLFPSEIERVLSELSGIADCGITSRPDPEWGEVVCAVIVESSRGFFQMEKIKQELKAKLEPRKIPREWITVSKIPRSSTGKILRAELRSLIPTRS